MRKYGHRLVVGGSGDPYYVLSPWTANMIAAVIESHSKPGDTFTSNNVWDWIGGDAELAHPNGTMGQAFRLAQARGVIRSTGRICQSTHPTRKRGMVRVWEYV